MVAAAAGVSGLARRPPCLRVARRAVRNRTPDPHCPFRPPPRPVWAAANGLLPPADGPAAFEARLKREAWGRARVSLACGAAAAQPVKARADHRPGPGGGPDPGGRRGPVRAGDPVRRAFGKSLAGRAAGAGPASPTARCLAGRCRAVWKPSQGIIAGLCACSTLLTAIDALVAVDLGGRPRYVGTPRDAAFFGVRDGIVEWRAGRDMALETTLCATGKGVSAAGRAERTTGYYDARSERS